MTIVHWGLGLLVMTGLAGCMDLVWFRVLSPAVPPVPVASPAAPAVPIPVTPDGSDDTIKVTSSPAASPLPSPSASPTTLPTVTAVGAVASRWIPRWSWVVRSSSVSQ